MIQGLFSGVRRLLVSLVSSLLGPKGDEELAAWKNQTRRKLNALRERAYAVSPWSIKLQKKVSGRMKIGMAVLAYERPEYLELCLDSLFRTNLYDYDITFLLQDDGSTDPGVREILEKPRDAKYRIVRSFTPKGPNFAGAAINKALKKLMELDEFDVVGWCDSDAVHHPEWLKQTMEICLWAKANHRDHILGPFSSFNSSDVEFHRVLGEYESPAGGYIVKRQMGMLNYFYFRDDLLRLGMFGEHQDDETEMTERFEKLGVRNFCTRQSLIEHAGHLSTLNPGRPAPVLNPVYGLNLPHDGWGPELARAGTLGYFKNVHRNPSWEDRSRSDDPIEVFFQVAGKDVEIAPLAIEGIRRQLQHPIHRITVVGPNVHEIKQMAALCDCVYRDENSILPIRISDLDVTIQGVKRNGWLFKQMLNLGLYQICETSRYFTIDSDTVMVRPIRLEVGGKTVLYHSDEHHEPYYEIIRRLLGTEPPTPLSFVAHQICIQSKRVAEMLQSIEDRFPGRKWYESIVDNLDRNTISGFAEYETYGQWMLATHPDEIYREYFFNLGLKRDQLKSLDELTRIYGQKYSTLSFHHYLN